MDHPGPVARTAQDLESMLRVMSGYDREDHSTFEEPLPEFTRLNKGLNGIIVGTCSDAFDSTYDLTSEGFANNGPGI